MSRENYISIRTFCQLHGVTESFVHTMYEFEILQIDQIQGEAMILEEELPTLEKLVRLHNELDINEAGIQAVYNLLQQVEELQNEVAHLRRKLDRFDL